MTKRFYAFKLPLLTLLLSKVILREKARQSHLRMLGALSREYLLSYSFFLQDLRALLVEHPLQGFVYKIMLEVAVAEIDKQLHDAYTLLDLGVEMIGKISKATVEEEVQTSFEFELKN